MAIHWPIHLRDVRSPSIQYLFHSFTGSISKRSVRRCYRLQHNTSAGSQATRPWRRQCSHQNQQTSHSYSTSTLPIESSAGITHSYKVLGEQDAVATITVSNPGKLNVVDSVLLRKIVEKCYTLSSDMYLRAVVLTGGAPNHGKSPSFIGGADIKEMAQINSPESATRFIKGVHEACQALRELPVPVIARVNGFALGAGLEIMAACDLRIATKQSVFGMPEVRVGIPSVVEAALLPGLIGMGRTRRLLYLAENITAPTAERWGLVERVVDDEESLDRAVGEWTKALVNMGPKAIRLQKKLMQEWENSTLDQGVRAGIMSFAEAYEDRGSEPKAFMNVFLNRSRTK